MQYVRFLSGNSIQWGLIEGGYIRTICGNLYEQPKAGEIVSTTWTLCSPYLKQRRKLIIF